MLSQKPIRIVIPAFNRPNRLEIAIKSILNQSYANFSLVVVDDASTKDLALCRKLVLEAGHHWIRLDENAGPAAARNRGTEDREFEWVMFLDSDDVWLPEKLERHVAWNQANPDCRISQVQETWIRNGTPFTKPKHLEQLEGRIFIESVGRCTIGPSCVAIRRDLWDETKGFDPWFRVCEDYELWLRITCWEQTGLVSGPPLIEKHGGHSDQLSTSVPALDRYRLVALAMFLNSAKPLSSAETDTVISMLTLKGKILAKGAKRRDRNDWSEFFETVTIPYSPADIEKAKQYCELP